MRKLIVAIIKRYEEQHGRRPSRIHLIRPAINPHYVLGVEITQ